MKPIQLQLKQISYSYNREKQVLKNVNLDISQGEKIAILGANGAGKSTLFTCMNGVITPDSGEIVIEGKKITKKNKIELTKKVAFVFQQPDNQIIAPTVLSEISFGAMNLKLPQEQVLKRVYEAMEYMNLKTFENRATHTLSGGEKKRVTIADSIVMQPHIYLFDEPTTALDPLHQQMLEEVLEKLSQQGKTILLSTHDVDFAYRFAQRVIVFYKGEIIADDTAETVFCNNKVLSMSNLKQPILLQIQHILMQKGLLKQCNIFAKNIQQFQKLI